MMFEVCSTDKGYVVEVFWPDKDGNRHWEPLRNFGDRQGDAIEFRDIDCPDLEDAVIRTLIKRYDPDVKYIRVENNRFYKQRP